MPFSVRMVQILALLLVTQGNVCDALQCYSCDDIFTPECADPFNPSAAGVNITEFVPGLTPCTPCKSCVKAIADVKASKEYFRTCYAIEEEEKCLTYLNATYCFCNENLCNNASDHTPLLSWIAFVMVWLVAG